MTGEVQPAASLADTIHDLWHATSSILQRARRYWPALPVSIVVAVGAFFIAPLIRPPIYRSEVVLALREGLKSDAFMTTEQNGEPTRVRNARLQAMVFSRPSLRALVERERIDPVGVAKVGMAAVIEQVAMRVGFSGGEGNTFVIQFTDKDPGLAQRAARHLGQSLVDRLGRDAADQAAATRKFLEDEEAKLAEALHVKEAAYAEFVTLHPEFALDRAQNQSPGVAVRAAAAAAPAGAGADPTAALRRQAERIRSRLSQIANPGAVVPGVQAPPQAEPQLTPESREAIASAQRDVQRAQDELSARQAKFTPLHPDVVSAQARLAAAEQRLRSVRAAAQRLAAQPSPAQSMPVPPVAPATEQALQKQLRNVEAAIASARPGELTAEASGGGAQEIVGLETRWAALTRSVEAAREQYESMQRRLFNAILVDAAQATGGGSQMVIVEDAYYPKLPFSRSRTQTGGLAAAAAVVLGIAIMAGLAFVDPRIMSQRDLERLDLAPIALYIPRLPGLPPRRRVG